MKLNKKRQTTRFGWMLAAAISTGVGTVALSQDDAEDDEIFELSPFEVAASANDIGYYSESTLAGSRLNTNVADLASSITVVTKQQLEDTASVDINDIFLYEANTEGLGNYTAYEMNRGGVKDLGAGHSRDSGLSETAATVNRIRGMGRGDTAQNNHPTIARMPLDEYNTQSVEINRGPNSLLFGLGTPAGIVNQTTAQAVLDTNKTELVARFGSWGSRRFSFNHNQSIIDGKLAVYVAALDDHRGFRRKPSYDDTQRQYAAITYKPFEQTTIRGSIERYQNQNRRPNYITPRDRITPWIQDGSPTYDANTRMVTYADGSQVGPFTRSIHSPGSVLQVGDFGVNGGNGDINLGQAINDANGDLFVESLNMGRTNPWLMVASPDSWDYVMAENWSPNVVPAGIDRTEAQHLLYDRQLMVTAAQLPPRNADGTLVMTDWVEPSLTDTSILDYHRVNVIAPNFGTLEGKTYNLEFQQKLAENLYFSAGWFRQHVDSLEQRPLSQQQATTVHINPNRFLVDGSPNPHFLSPYVEDYQADTFNQPETNESMQAMLAYQFDFTENDGWVGWLGSHRAMAFASQHDIERRRIRSRLATVGGDPRWYTPRSGEQSYAQNNSNIYRHYYIGSNGVIDSPNLGIANPGPIGGGGPTDYTISTYNWENDTWNDLPVNLNTEHFWATTLANQREISSTNFALQSYFWDNRIVTTVGFRSDDFKARTSDPGAADSGLLAGRIQDISTSFSQFGDWEELSGSTSTRGVVFKPIRWDDGEFTLHYNESDNFNPPNDARTDFFGQSLGKPEGEGRDYGIGVNLFGGKLFARVNWFEVDDRNSRGVSSVFVDRTLRVDDQYLRRWADLVVRVRSGGDPTDENWNLDESGAVIPLTPAQEDQVAELMGLPYDFRTGLAVDGTQTVRAEGMEVQVVYNPLPNWNLKFTGGKQETFYSDIAPQWDPWFEERSAHWDAAAASDMPETFLLRGAREVSLRNFRTAYGFDGAEIAPDNQFDINSIDDWIELNLLREVSFIRTNEGSTVPGLRKWRFNLISNYRFTDGMLKNFTVGGGVRWQDKAIIGYYGMDQNGDGTLNAKDISRPVYDEAQTSVDLWASYSRMIFDDKIRLRFQLNVRDAFESGGIDPIAVNYDGSPFAYRIRDPREILFTTRLEF